jgi:hypothetical protein
VTPVSTAKRILKPVLPAARRWRDRLDAAEIRQARQLLQRVRQGPLDVLYLADSTAYFVSPTDTERLQFRFMLISELQRDLSILAIGGGGYHPGIWSNWVRLMTAASSQRPLMIVPLSLRPADDTWLYHPRHGHQAAVATLGRMPDDYPAWRVRRIIRRPTSEDMLTHDLRPHPSFLGEDLTIGDYRRRLTGPDSATLDKAERNRWLHAYQYTRPLRMEDDGPRRMTAFAAKLRELQFPAIAYQTPSPLQIGTELWGSKFVDRVRENHDLLEEAFVRGYPETKVLRTGMNFEPSEFLVDGTEHLNELGRHKLLKLLVPEVRLVHERRSAGEPE